MGSNKASAACYERSHLARKQDRHHAAALSVLRRSVPPRADLGARTADRLVDREHPERPIETTSATQHCER